MNSASAIPSKSIYNALLSVQGRFKVKTCNIVCNFVFALSIK